MKTFGEVITQKRKFIELEATPFYLLYEDRIYSESFSILETGYDFSSQDEIKLLDEISPMFVYICSCLVFYGMSFLDLYVKLTFHDTEFSVEKSFSDESTEIFKNPFSKMKTAIDENMMYGYLCFTDKFKIEFILIPNESEEIIDFVSDTEEGKEIPEYSPETINDFKTFKAEKCVICLDDEPKVLFCNCGHICVCEACLKKFDNCPMCKMENTTLRII